MQKRITLLFLGLFLCLGGSAFAQKNIGKISGKVIEASNGQAVEYATVSILKPTDSTLINGTITTTDGSWKVEGLANGKYIVRVSFMGYETYFHPTPVEITASKNTVNIGK